MGCDSSKEIKVVPNHSSDGTDSNENDKTVDENSLEPEQDPAEGE